jgi:hypothetical protein
LGLWGLPLETLCTRFIHFQVILTLLRFAPLVWLLCIVEMT